MRDQPKGLSRRDHPERSQVESPEISSENSPETSPEISPEDSTGEITGRTHPEELTGNRCAGSCHISRHIQKLAPAKARRLYLCAVEKN